MATAKLEIQSSTPVQPKNFTYPKGLWTVPTQECQPASLINATIVEAAGMVNYDTRSTSSVRITFQLYKPRENYGWGTNVSNLCISAAVGENGQPTLISINQEYVDMETQTVKPFRKIFNLMPNYQASDEKLHFKLVDNLPGQKGGLLFLGATVEVLG